ncbi:MAG: GEVED domain-containing protein [Cyanobacteria bacterium J06554_6]
MFPAGALGNRGNIVWSGASAGGFRDRTLLRVYANAGEYILVSSSAVGVDDGNIQIFSNISGTVANENLGASVFSCVTQRGANAADTNRGFISSRAEELAGPRSIDGTGNTAGYEPCYYQAPTTGIYYIAMYGPQGPTGGDMSGANNGVEPDINTLNTGSNQGTGISAWDVTIRSSLNATTDIIGRLHTYYIAMNMGDNGRQLHSDLYPITVDGYRYEIDIRGLDPFGFRIYGNQFGNLDSDGQTPLYRDVLGSNGSIGSPSGGVSSAPPLYPIFLNPIDSTAVSALTVYDPLTGAEVLGRTFPGAPILPSITTASFSGSISENRSNVNVGGTFSFDSNLPSGTYEIVISYDGVNFDPTRTENRVIRGFMPSSGAQTSTWDGRDNLGNPFPVGAYSYKIAIRGGEYHFPVSDAENNVNGGPTYRLLNATNPLGNTIAFYDHRGYRTLGGTTVADRDTGDGDPFDDALCGTNPPSPAVTDLELGADSSAAGFNAFGVASGGNTNSRCTGAFGDTKILDLWTYLPSNRLQREIIIEETTPEFDHGDAPDTSAGNSAGDYSTLSGNNGPRHALGTTAAKLYLGAGVVSDADGFVDGVDDNGNATDDSDNAFTAALPSVSPGSAYNLNNIPVVNNSGVTGTLHGWVDFNQNGQFELSEYASVTVASGTTSVNLSWSAPATTTLGTTYARFRLTTDATLVDSAGTTDVDERSLGAASDGEVEDYAVSVVNGDPEVVLVKRITALNSQTQTTNGHDLSAYRNEGGDPNDDNTLPWPTPLTTTLVGGTNGGSVMPDDTLEYTIYFLSSGDRTAENIRFCDYIPTYTQLVTGGFNGNTPAAGGLTGADLSVEIFQNGSSTYHTGASDGDAAVYFPPGVDPANDSRFAGIDCDGDGNALNANPNGAIAVDLGNILNASSATNVANQSYGYVRFRARVR